jgi:hypothetical protein
LADDALAAYGPAPERVLSRMPATPVPIPERSGVTPQVFRDEILPAARPVVLRGLVSDWPLAQAGGRSAAALAAYIGRFDRGQPTPTMLGPPAIRGRFFYNRDLSGFNFQQGSAKIGAALEFLAAHAADAEPPAFAIQSAPVRGCLPGMEAENRMALLGDAVEPRVWIGNRVTVAAHHDPSENIACVAAGRRRFTLFPPEQVANLYMGPFELTPAGATISLVDFDAPDLERFPRFPQAMAAALVAELEPGDAIYIPYLWWHEVRSLDPVNMLVNYWWAPPAAGRGAPREAFLHAMVALKALPKAHREAWRVMLDHYVFEDGAEAGEHIPPDRRGLLGEMDAATLKELRAAIARTLARP